MNKKIKLLTISDHPYAPSGVGHQSRLMMEALLKTGKFSIISLAGALRHENYNPQKIEGYGDDWIVFPVDGYGNQEQVRSILFAEKPDILWIMTDPRFFIWLWAMEQEIRQHIPIVYYHVWDNFPPPTFNKPYYDSNDLVVTISKLTERCVRTVSPDVECFYLPHTVNHNIFKKLPRAEVETFKKQSFAQSKKVAGNKMIFFFNSRNARRKQSGTLIYWFRDFLNIVGHDNAMLIMHTDPNDEHGQDLNAIIKEFGLDKGQVLFSTQKMPSDGLTKVYNMADCTVSISDAEGFGLSVEESLSCETPVICTMTGGMQEQVTDGEKWFGIGIQPAATSLIGSQDVPYIYEDRISREDFIDAMLKMYNMKQEEREKMGAEGRAHIIKNYNYDNYCNRWIEILTNVYEKYGSWNTREGYKAWALKEIK